jgi:4-hydroxybutyryl-CoA dehydratase/vinylacetyl-CoA-Delta-isomerase
MRRGPSTSSVAGWAQIYADGELSRHHRARPVPHDDRSDRRWVREHYRPALTCPVRTGILSFAELKELLVELLSGTWSQTTSRGLLRVPHRCVGDAQDQSRVPERIEQYFDSPADLRCVQAITDAKGDRRLSLSKQEDPTSTRIVERRSTKIFRAKPTSLRRSVTSSQCADQGDEAKEEDWAIARAVPVMRREADREHELRTPARTSPTTPTAAATTRPKVVIFDDAFVPNEWVFPPKRLSTLDLRALLGLWSDWRHCAHGRLRRRPRRPGPADR